MCPFKLLLNQKLTLHPVHFIEIYLLKNTRHVTYQFPIVCILLIAYSWCTLKCSSLLRIFYKLASGSKGLIRIMFDLFVKTQVVVCFFWCGGTECPVVSLYVNSCCCSLPRSINLLVGILVQRDTICLLFGQCVTVHN